MSNFKFGRLILVLEITLVIFLLVSIGLLFSACKCTHEYEEKITKPASCSSDGEATYTCKKCGDSYTEVLSKLNTHEISSEYLCDGDGHWQKCENCDYKTEKVAHTYAYLKQGDLHWQKCEICGFSTDEESHKFVIQGAIIPSTCTVKGSSVKACACGETHTEELALADHNYTVYQKEGDLHWQKCSNCESITSKTEHKFTIQGQITQSTCTEQGSDVRSCVCGATHVETLSLAPHSYTKTVFDDDGHWLVCDVCDGVDANQSKTLHGFITNRTEAECGKTGSIVTTCSGCDFKNTETLPALEHILDKSGFSKSATGSGHYYKCTLCNKDIAESHTLSDCECPDGYNCSATCYKGGHQDQKCDVCEWQNHFTTARTDEHNVSGEWQHDGVWHWHACTNGEGNDACDYKEDSAQHSWEDKLILATCTEDGHQWRECSVCGERQSGSSKTLKATGHDYSQLIEILESPTCDQDGVAKMKCTKCDEFGEVVLKKLGHDWSEYNFNAQGHWKKCATCGAEQDNDAPTKHTADKSLDEVIAQADCVSDGKIKHTCQFCKGEYEEVIAAKGHNYVHDDPYHEDPTKFADPTCTEPGWYMATCSICGDNTRIVGNELRPHDVIYHKGKDPTDTENGNIGYHECRTCGKYFSSSNCETEIKAEDIFIYANGIAVDSFSELYDIAASMENGETSRNYYRITASVVTLNGKNLSIADSNDEKLTIYIPENIKLGLLYRGDEITLLAKLFVLIDDGTVLYDLTDIKIVSVPEMEGEYLLYVESNVNDFGTDCNVQVYYGEEQYDINTAYFYALVPELDDQLVINYVKNNRESNVSLVKVVVNGQAVTVHGGEILLTITGDMHVKLVFGTMPSTSVSIDKIDAVNGNTHIVDEYVSYTYVGNTSNNGYINANSHLIFNINNANIVGIIITYENYNLSGDNTVLQNSLSVGRDTNHMNVQTQTINENLKVILDFDAENGYIRVDYFANACQANIAEITIRYKTDNTF